MVEVNVTINRPIVLKTYNQSNIEQLGRCSVRIRHNDKCIKCKFFAVLGNSPALIRIQDIKLLGIIRVICETIGSKTNDRMFDI